MVGAPDEQAPVPPKCTGVKPVSFVIMGDRVVTYLIYLSNFIRQAIW